VTAAVPETTVDRPDPAGEGRGWRKGLWVAAAVLALVGAGLWVGLADAFSSAPSGVPTGNPNPTGLYTVTRQTLLSQTQVTANLGYAGSYTVVNQSRGTLTSLPPLGQVVSQGQVVYQVSGAPVVLLYGPTPAYRTLSSGMSGPDVRELNAALVALGYATSSQLSPTTNSFSTATTAALERLEAALGVTQNGMLTLGQAVFLPTALRVTAVSATLGQEVQTSQSIIQGTSTARQVSIPLDAAEQSEVKVGDEVSITLPDNETTPGVISSVGTVATTPPSSGPGNSGPSSPTVTVLVNPTDPASTGSWDQAPVNVTITTGRVSDALVVPVDALLAQAGGGYAVEVVGADGAHHLTSVTLGLFDDADGLVQVSGSDLAAGQRVVVPAL
jgi:hypothetical protein